MIQLATLACLLVQMTDVCDAVRKGDLKTLRALIEAKPELARTPDEAGFQPLHYAATKEIAEYLLSKGADVNAQTPARPDFIGGIHRSYNGLQTPLHGAALAGRVELATLLLEKGARVEARTQLGATALHAAARNGNAALIRRLLESKADVNALPPKDDLLSVLQETPLFVGPLHVAAEAGHLEAVKILIEAKANLDLRDAQGRTALHRLLDDFEFGKLLELFEIRMDGRYPPRLKGKARRGDREEILKLLVAKGADVNAADHGNLTPLQMARESKNERAIGILRAAGAKE